MNVLSSFEQYLALRTEVCVLSNCLQQRTEKREKEEGKFVPVDAVMGMK